MIFCAILERQIMVTKKALISVRKLCFEFLKVRKEELISLAADRESYYRPYTQRTEKDGKLQEIRTYGQSFRNNPNEKFLLMILCSQAKLENDNKSVTIKRGMRARAALGWRPGNVCIGYLNQTIGGRKTIVLDPERADTVTEMFRRVAEEQWSGRRIKRWLDDIGFTSKRGGRLSLSQTYGLLNNPFYYGEFTYNGELRTGMHQPLISKETFEATRRTIESASPKKQAWGSKRLPYRRLFMCGQCGNSMTPEELNGQTYLRCTGYTKEKGRCDNSSISLEEIAQQAISAVNYGALKRSSFLPTFHPIVDEHYQITRTIMAKRGVEYTSTTRLRDYINHTFTLGTIEAREIVFKQLKMTPKIVNRKIII